MMGLLDTVKNALKGKGKQADDGIDNVVGGVDDKTGGKHTEQIEDASDKANSVVDKLDD